MNVRGTSHLFIVVVSGRMKMLHEDVNTIGEDIRESLDEKRNFYNYLLAVVTVFLGPMTILTGYWCVSVVKSWRTSMMLCVLLCGVCAGE